VAVVDAARHALVKTIALSGADARPMGVVAAPDGRQVYVTTGRGKTVVILDTSTNKPVGEIEVGQRPWGIAVSPDGATLYTANGPSNDVSIVDIARRTVTARIKVGDSPWGLVLAPGPRF
jgi:YVTN family beta-propeller protein